MSLRSALQTLNNAVEDLTSLHVQTFTGTVDFEIGDKDGFDKVRSAVQAARTKENSAVKLVAEAYYRFDGDSFNFLSSDASATMIQGHDRSA